MTEQEIERCLERFATCKTTDVMNFDYAGTFAYIKRLKAENASLRNEADENAALSMENKMRADRLEKENAVLSERLEKTVELTVKECLRILHNIGGCDATDDFSQGWDEATNTAFKKISEKYGVSAEKVLDDE